MVRLLPLGRATGRRGCCGRCAHPRHPACPRDTPTNLLLPSLPNRPNSASEVYVTGDFDKWSTSVKLDKVGDTFEKLVELPDASTKIYYKVSLCSRAPGASLFGSPDFLFFWDKLSGWGQPPFFGLSQNAEAFASVCQRFPAFAQHCGNLDSVPRLPWTSPRNASAAATERGPALATLVLSYVRLL